MSKPKQTEAQGCQSSMSSTQSQSSKNIPLEATHRF